MLTVTGGRHAWLVGLGLLLAGPAAAAETGLQAEVRVGAPTRLDWEFVASGFGPGSAKLPADFDSRDVRYQLYVPKDYHARKPWPLVVFISPGDDPLGWRYWQKPCEALGMFFCAAYGAGNNCPPGLRIRKVLDVFDDVRRRYSIDPDQTYVAGFSGGGRIACTIAYALPEYCGGLIPVCGTNPLNPLSYLRHRAQDRLSAAFVTGSGDFNRKENEEYMFPMVREMGVRARLWVVPKLGHGIPPPEVLKEVHAWLADDLPRRRADAKARPGLTVQPDEVPTALQQATRQVETAQAELKDPKRVWRAVALLQGVQVRWGETPAAGKAILLFEKIEADPKRAVLFTKQRDEEEMIGLASQGRALERFGQRHKALEAWQLIVRRHPGTAEADKAKEEVKRLTAAITASPRRPYLGVSFAGQTTRVAQVVPDGPAARAGIKAGDVLVKLGETPLTSLPDLLKALEKHKPGERVAVEVQSKGKSATVKLEIGSRAAPGDE
jgi:hypothetical protein